MFIKLFTSFQSPYRLGTILIFQVRNSGTERQNSLILENGWDSNPRSLGGSWAYAYGTMLEVYWLSLIQGHLKFMAGEQQGIPISFHVFIAPLEREGQ